jgi:hypothetical protein
VNIALSLCFTSLLFALQKLVPKHPHLLTPLALYNAFDNRLRLSPTRAKASWQESKGKGKPTMATTNTASRQIQELKQVDDARPGFPGEHWIVLVAGLGAWLASRRHPSLMMRTLGLMAGTALVGRAASGRDGVARLVRYLPVGSGIRR